MGTRADFYVGRGESAEWIGSIAWDGHPKEIPKKLRKARTEEKFRRCVAKLLASREDSTTPDLGWPWPWDDSQTTDFSYAFDVEKCEVFGTCFGHGWWPIQARIEGNAMSTNGKVAFPDMSQNKKTTFGPRSGVIFVGMEQTNNIIELSTGRVVDMPTSNLDEMRRELDPTYPEI